MFQRRGRVLPKLWRRTFSVLYFLASTLIILVTYDSFAHGSSFLFVAILGVTLGVVGYVASISLFRGGGYSRFVSIWVFLISLFYYATYGMINKEIFGNPGIILITLIYTISSIVFVFFNPNTRERKKCNLSTKSKILISIIFFLFLAIAIAIPWESKINLIFEPNQEGSENYENDELSVFVEGGFVYRVEKAILFSDNDMLEIAVKSKSPKTRITINPKVDTKLRLNFLGIARGGTSIEVDGESYGPMPYLSGEVLTHSLEGDVREPDPGVVESKEYIESRKGTYIDLSLKGGTEEVVSLSRETKKDNLHFYVFSDLHSGYSVSFPVFFDILKGDSDFVVLNGDIVNDGYRSEYRTASALSELFPIPVYTTIGNHDTWNGGEKEYANFFGKTNYSYMYKDYLFVFLDNESGHVEEPQFAWLEEVLKAGTPGRIFVFSHMPPIDTLTGRFDDKEYPNAELRHSMFNKAESDRLMSLLSEYGVYAHIAGHTHEHGTVTLGGVQYITSGALGGTVNAGDSVSYLEVTEDGEEIEVINHDVLESYEIENQEVRNKLHAARVFAAPFLVDKSIRANLAILWLIALSYFVIYYLRKEKK
ncbi:MAG: metallophosphoesterase [Patescibacteria group bacterium]|nr:metallophosphoesterase [Patescibacteria group bacterium]